MPSMIPRLRKVGVLVERGRRPNSRGIRYRLYRIPDITVAIVYNYEQLLAWTEYLAGSGDRPGPSYFNRNSWQHPPGVL